MSEFVRKNIQNMQGYSWGEQPTNKDDLVKLNTNENAYPASQDVATAIAHLNLDDLRTYPAPLAYELRKEIAQLHNISLENVVLINGGDEGLRLAMTTFVSPGEAFCFASPSYSLYPVLANIQDALICAIPYTNSWEIPDQFASRVSAHNAKLTCLVNPHAPSGTLYTTDEIGQLAEQIPGVLLIDEAYADFIDPILEYRSTSLLEKHDNIMILRTFSKGYSLAGLRLGYLLGSSPLIEPIINKTRDSYNIGYIQQKIGLSAIKDQDHARTNWSKTRENRTNLREKLSELGLVCPPSQSNFLLAQVGKDVGISAKAIYLALKDMKIYVRYFEDPKLEDHLRITVGTPEQNAILVSALEEILA